MEWYRRLAELQALELYRQAIEAGQLSAAVSAAKHLHRLWGLLDRDTNHDHQGSNEPTNEFSGRSMMDLRFYAEHGCWPEDYREPDSAELKNVRSKALALVH